MQFLLNAKKDEGHSNLEGTHIYLVQLEKYDVFQGQTTMHS